MTTEEWITPEKAQEYLATASVDDNRRLNENVVRHYADDMVKGLWRFAGDAICFNKSGVLIDGQHRLRAIVKTGLAQKFVVVRNLDEDVIMVKDKGYARQTAHNFEIKGVKNAVMVAALSDRILRYDNGMSWYGHASINSAKFSDIEKYEAYAKEPEHFQDLQIHKANRSRKCIDSSTLNAMGFILKYRKGYNRDFVNAFFQQIFSLETSENGMLNCLRRIFVLDMSSQRKMTTECKIQLLIKTWNFYSEGRCVKRIVWQENEPKHELR